MPSRASTSATPAVAGSGTARPPHRYAQRELAALASALLPGSATSEVFERFFDRVGVNERHLALPADAYAGLAGLKARNDAWLAAAVPLAEAAVSAALNDAGLSPGDVDALFSVTVTGLAVPSLDARLMNRLPFCDDVKRVPIFGLGCLGGAAGVARAADYLRAFPTQAAVLVSVELCSLTLQHDDLSVANVISSGLFGDGAAALVLVGAEHPRSASSAPRILDSLSRFLPDTERLMGWDVVDTGFRIVLSPDIPSVARTHTGPFVDSLLSRGNLTRADVGAWVIHPGGPAVIAAIEESLDLASDALTRTRESLSSLGNLSSASVLCLLDDFRKSSPPARDTYGVMMALGPAFSAEGVLLRW